MIITPQMVDVLTKWERAQEAANMAIRDELDAREAVVKAFFPNPHEGTMNAALPDGVNRLQGAFKNTYKLDKERTPLVAASLPKAVRDNLIKYDPRLSVSAYRGLEPTHRQIIDTVVTMTPSRPTLKIEEIKRR